MTWGWFVALAVPHWGTKLQKIIHGLRVQGSAKLKERLKSHIEPAAKKYLLGEYSAVRILKTIWPGELWPCSGSYFRNIEVKQTSPSLFSAALLDTSLRQAPECSSAVGTLGPRSQLIVGLMACCTMVLPWLYHGYTMAIPKKHHDCPKYTPRIQITARAPNSKS